MSCILPYQRHSLNYSCGLATTIASFSLTDVLPKSTPLSIDREFSFLSRSWRCIAVTWFPLETAQSLIIKKFFSMLSRSIARQSNCALTSLLLNVSPQARAQVRLQLFIRDRLASTNFRAPWSYLYSIIPFATISCSFSSYLQHPWHSLLCPSSSPQLVFYFRKIYFHLSSAKMGLHCRHSPLTTVFVF